MVDTRTIVNFRAADNFETIIDKLKKNGGKRTRVYREKIDLTSRQPATLGDFTGWIEGCPPVWEFKC